MFLSYKYRLLPNKSQHQALATISEGQRQLYNAALQERIDCYRKTEKTISYMSQSGSLTTIRKDDPAGYGALPVTLSRATLQRLHRAFDGFFRRVRAGQSPGYPRFKGRDHWRGFGFSEWEGVRLDGKRLRIKGLRGGIRIHMHRSLPPGRIASCQIVRDAKGWFVCLQTEVVAAEKKPIQRSVGIDVGLSAFAFQSDGIAIPAPQVARRADRELRLRSRALERCKRGSRGRKKARQAFCRLHAKISNTRRTWLHQLSARITNTYDLIAVEDLNVAGMVRCHSFARSISDAAWSTFTNMLSYKAEKAGGTFIKVDPKMTSQICSGCGDIVRKGLSDRVHNCPGCGLILDRDHNAALNILRRGMLPPGTGNVTHVRGERRARNIKVATSRDSINSVTGLTPAQDHTVER